jgi:transposase
MSTDASSHDLPNDLAALRDLLLAERARFEQQSATIACLEQTVVAQQRTIEQQQHRIAQLLRRTFGPKQERIDLDQLLLFDSAELSALIEEREQEEQEASSSSAKRRRKGHGRRALPAHLPREQRRYELTEAERQCPGCGEARQEIGQETSEQLEYVPAAFKVIEHLRVKYACRRCEEHVSLAAKPSQPVEKGLPGPGLLAQVVLSKYGDHTPLYRQEDIFSRHGILIRRSTLCDWIASAADLAEPLHERMCELVRRSKVIHTDDTTVPLVDPLAGRTRPARFWAYVGDAAGPYSVYDFTESRKRDGPAQWLEGFSGYLQADAYGGYDGLYQDARRSIVEVACWAHTRRYWWEAKTTDAARAHQGLAFIARLYQIEAMAKELSPVDRCALRQAQAVSILAEFGTWLENIARDVLPKSPIGEALRYTQNQWEALERYTTDGDLAIDNNLSERTVKIAALGRKNWLFVGSPKAGRRAAVLLSLVASAKANHVEPWAWLRDLFTQLPNASAETLDRLLPDRWLEANPASRWHIDDLRRDERDRKRG